MEFTPQNEKAVIDATRPYAVESAARSWFHVLSTFALLSVVLGIAAQPLVWPTRLAVSIVGGLLLVRAFILFHDFMHGALLRNSWVAKRLFHAFGLVVLTPPSVWRETHNYHHAHTAQMVGSHVGSFPVVTIDMWQQMSPSQRFKYKLVRHPLTILFAYLPLFFIGMGIQPFLRAPKKHPMAAVAAVLHASAWILAAATGHFAAFFFGLGLPVIISQTLGGYLFYAQHNFPDLHVQPRVTWSYARAALESSSYMTMSPLMHFFTGNIGYHHVHHLNPGIPFYRLPEAMAGIPELQNPGTTSLWPKDIVAALRLKVWDPERNRMVSYAEIPERPTLCSAA